MIVLGIMVLYFALGVLTARKLVYEMMCTNEQSEIYGIPLEARLYTHSEYRSLIRGKVGDYGIIPDSAVPPSDLTIIVYKSFGWPLLWTLRTLHAMVMKGHKKTPGQREKELKECERKMRELEAQRDREWRNKLKEAGVEE